MPPLALGLFKAVLDLAHVDSTYLWYNFDVEERFSSTTTTALRTPELYRFSKV